MRGEKGEFIKDELYQSRGPRQMPERVKYYVSQAGEQFGPLTFGQLQGYFRVGSFTDDAYYWYEGMEEWCRLDDLKELLTVKQNNHQESREQKRQQRLEKRKRERQANRRQVIIMLAALIALTAGVALVIYFAGQLY